jgi:hypothetical protein
LFDRPGERGGHEGSGAWCCQDGRENTLEERGGWSLALGVVNGRTGANETRNGNLPQSEQTQCHGVNNGDQRDIKARAAELSAPTKLQSDG